MRDLVVLLPGILGSTLQKDDKDLWAISGQAVSQMLFRAEETIDNLKLNQDDPEAKSLGDGIQAAALIQDTHLIPGFWKIDGYTKIAHLITNHFDVIAGDIYNDPDDRAANFYQFPYAWQRDNRANARIFVRLIGMPNAAVPLKAEIQSVSNQHSSLVVDFVEQENEWTLAIDQLPAGLYRFTVKPADLANAAPSPVHDLFEVIKN
jgi:hypothetical protein